MIQKIQFISLYEDLHDSSRIYWGRIFFNGSNMKLFVDPSIGKHINNPVQYGIFPHIRQLGGNMQCRILFILLKAGWIKG